MSSDGISENIKVHIKDQNKKVSGMSSPNKDLVDVMSKAEPSDDTFFFEGQ